MDTPSLILASGSPRRRRILGALGVEFTVLVPDVAEVHWDDDPVRTVSENARDKAEWSRRRRPDARIIAADTVVASAGVCLGKPDTRSQAEAWLLRCSGQDQEIFTAVGFWRPGQGEVQIDVARSVVRFRELTPSMVGSYLDLVDPLDKAGGYDIGQHGDMIIASCKGSFTSVVGLPHASVSAWLDRCDVPRHRPMVGLPACPKAIKVL